MFREMVRKQQELSFEENVKVLENGTSGVLALLGDDGYPYAIPLSYIYEDSKLYFHGAKWGHKIDAIKKCDKASFCVIATDDIVPEQPTTYFKSVIVFGKVRIMEDASEIREAISKLATKYSSYGKQEKNEVNVKEIPDIMAMIEFDIEHMTGKWKEKEK